MSLTEGLQRTSAWVAENLHLFARSATRSEAGAAGGPGHRRGRGPQNRQAGPRPPPGPPSSSSVKRRAQSSSTGSALTRVRCTTAPAITSKIRSAVRAGRRRRPGSGGQFAAGLGALAALRGPAASGGRRSTSRIRSRSALVRRGLGDHRHQRRLGLRAAPAAPRTGGPRPRCRPPGCRGRAVPARRRAPPPRPRPARSCPPSGGRGSSWRRPPASPRRPASACDQPSSTSACPGRLQDRGVGRRRCAGGRRCGRSGGAALHAATIPASTVPAGRGREGDHRRSRVPAARGAGQLRYDS